MNRLSFFSALAVVSCIMIAPAARSAPTTQPSLEQENQRLKDEVARLQQKVDAYRRQLDALRGPHVVVPLPSIPMQPQTPMQPRLPSPRAIPPTQIPAPGWSLRKQNTNVWHWVVPVDSQY